MRRSLAYAALPALSILFLACATGGTPGGDGDGDVDAGTINGPDASGVLPDASQPDAAPIAALLSQNTATTITDANTISCNNINGHTENSYYRVFDLAALGIDRDLLVNKVSLGIESSTAAGGNHPMSVRLHRLNGTFVTSNLTQILSAQVQVANQTLQPLDVNVLGTVPVGSTLVVEIFLPDSNDTGHLFIASNTAGQSAPSFLRAPDCGTAEPADIAALGFPTVHVVMTVEGEY